MNSKRMCLAIVSVSLLTGFLLTSLLVQTSMATNNGANQIFLPIVTQPKSQHWIRHYSGNGDQEDDVATTAIATQDGGSILLIEQGSSPSGDPQDDLIVLKISATGDIVWQKGFGVFDFPEFHLDGLETSDGDLVISGLSFHNNTNSAEVIKMTADGIILWQRHFGGANFDYASSIQETADGGYIFTGYTASFGVGITDLWLVKMDKDGNTLWQKTVATSFSQFGNDVQQTSDGGYIVAGQESFGDFIYDLWVVKFDSSGSVVWQKTYGGSEQDYGRAILQTNDGGYIVVGATESAGAGESDAWIMRLNGSGDIVWQKSYGGLLNDEANAIYPTSNGHFIIAGTTESFGAGESDTWLFVIDINGNIIWQKTYGGPDEETGIFIEQLDDGKLMATGYTGSYGNGRSDAWVLKLDPNGNIDDCDVIGVSTATVMNTAVTAQVPSIILGNSQANPVSSALPTINPNFQMGSVCE